MGEKKRKMHRNRASKRNSVEIIVLPPSAKQNFKNLNE